MTREEFYKLTDILDFEVLGNFMHGGEASEVIAQFEEAVENSCILKEKPVSTRDKLRALSDGKQHLGWLDDAREVEEEPVSEGKDIFDNCLKSEEKFILPQKISGNINCENCLYSSACALGDIQACIIDKPVSEDLGEYVNELSKQFPEVSFAKLSRIAVRVANWQKQQDQSTIELAEDHAMLAGMEKMKEEMMEKAIDATLLNGNLIKQKRTTHPLHVGDKVKVIVITED